MVRQLAFVLWASKGGLNHEQIMRLTWRQFDCYRESFTWLLSEQDEKGKQENARNDLLFIKDDPRLKDIKKHEVEKAHAALAKMKERMKARALQ